MLINCVPGEECRIALVENGKLEEFYQERASSESHVGNIYKGKVTNIEPSIQAAFVDFGLERNGFLHVSDLHPMYFSGKTRDDVEQIGSKIPRHERPPIQKCLRRGQDVLVQVLKEGIGTKGPTLTSYLSIPGRFLVMMPHMDRMGVSRKIDDDEARREIRQVLTELDPPQGFGFIVRTAGVGQTKTDLKRDLAYLGRLWKAIDQRMAKTPNVGELYAESDLVIRTIRDVFSTDITRIVVDDAVAARRARDFLAVANPRARSKVLYYTDPVPLFHRFGIEAQIDVISSREVQLPSGGSLVFDQAEALVAIDVNSGKSRDARDAESNAFGTNKEAADEICRQLRLRDLGGVVIMDLIDMRDLAHRRQIEARIRKNLKNDRSRTRINTISQFGILEMTRQRMRPSLKTTINIECSHCIGAGSVRSPESVVLDVMRRLALVMHHKKVATVELTISPDVAFQLLNRKRAQLVELEERHGKPVVVRVGGATADYVHISAVDERQVTLNLQSLMQRDEADIDTAAMCEDMLGDPLPQETTTTTPDAAKSKKTKQQPDESPDAPSAVDDQATDEDDAKKKRRRRRRGGRGRRKRSADAAEAAAPTDQTAATDDPQPDSDQAATTPEESTADNAPTEQSAGALSPRRKRRRRSRSRSSKKSDDAGSKDALAITETESESAAVPPALVDVKVKAAHVVEPAAQNSVYTNQHMEIAAGSEEAQ